MMMIMIDCTVPEVDGLWSMLIGEGVSKVAVVLLLLIGVLKMLLLLLLLSTFILPPLRMAVGFETREEDEMEGVNLGIETPPPPPPPTVAELP